MIYIYIYFKYLDMNNGYFIVEAIR